MIAHGIKESLNCALFERVFTEGIESCGRTAYAVHAILSAAGVVRAPICRSFERAHCNKDKGPKRRPKIIAL
jgi:hypothetical protein